MEKTKRLIAEYAFPGFRPASTVRTHPKRQHARIITLSRRQKKRSADPAGQRIELSTTVHANSSATWHVQMRTSISTSRSGVSNAGSAGK